MIISKKFNNNAVMCTKKGKEMILLGNGLGFGVGKGDPIVDEKVEKVFILDNDNTNLLLNTLSEVPAKYIELTKKAIKLAEADLNVKLSDYLFLSLSDHLYHAALREIEGDCIKNPLGNEIKRIYAKEYEVSKKIIELIFNDINIVFDDNEAVLITLHLVNGQQNLLDLNVAPQTIPRMVKDIIKIVEFHFSIELDKKTVHYDRFLLHLKSFVERSMKQVGQPIVEKPEAVPFFDDLKQKDWKSYECVKKIASYIKKKENLTISEDEKFYLFVYLYRITNKN